MTLPPRRLKLTPERTRHLITLAVGIAISWTLAALMACAHNGKAGGQALYEQLGGEQGLAQVAGRLIDRVSADPRTRRSFDGIKLPALKDSLTRYLCVVADGPCRYEGVTMAQSHAELNITGAEFDVMVGLLREELDRAQTPTAAKNELLRRLAPTRRDIVKGA